MELRRNVASLTLGFHFSLRFEENLRHLLTSQWQLPVRLPLPKDENLLDEPAQQAVICGLRDGHRASWTALYDGYSTDLWRYVARLVGSSSNDIADVVQETFLAAARSARHFDPGRGTLWTWLTGIAHHQIAQHWRQVGKRARILELAQTQAVEIGRGNFDRDGVRDVWERGELADLIRAALASLSSDYASILIGKYMDELSLEELTQREGGTVDAMKSKLARARREFRVRFERITREPGSVLDDSLTDERSGHRTV